MPIASRTLIQCAAISLLSAVTAFPSPSVDTRIAEAVKGRKVESVRALLEQHADVNAPLPDGATALHWAAQWDDVNTADLLLQAHAQVDAASVYGVTPLSLACVNGGAAMVTKLLAAGANPNLALPNGETPLMTASRTGKVDAVNALLAHGADVKAVESTRKQNALMWAAAEGHIAVVQALIDAGADVHSASSTGYTALLFAASHGETEITKLLLAKGANVNQASTNGTTALVLAIASDHIPYAESLLNLGADPNLGPGYSPLHLAAATEGFVEGMEGAEEGGGGGGSALWGPPKAKLIKLLLAHGANVNAKATRPPKGVGTGGATPFFLAAWAADPDTMRLLHENGADPKAATPQGTTPLMVAAGVLRQAGGPNVPERRALEAVKLCVEWGNDVNAANKSHGDTALHGAAYRGMHGGAEITKYLIAEGANVNAVNTRGWTPLIIADGLYFSTYNTTSQTTADVLRKAGATPPPADRVTNTGIRSTEVWYEPGCEPATLGSEGKCKS
jgi:ankyrin repeat protein